MKKLIKNGFGLLAVFCLGIGMNVYAESTPETGVQVSPIRFDWKMSGGEQKMDEIILHNFSDVPHDMTVSVEDFYVSDDTLEPSFFVPDENHPLKAYDVIDWIDAPEDFTIEPGETKKLQFIVTVPEGQPTSGYYGTVFFKTRTDDVNVKNVDGGSVKMKVNYRVGTLVLLSIAGDEPMKIGGNLEEFNVIKKVFWDSPITLFAKIHSTGNVHYRASGQMEVKKFGNKFAVVKIDSENLYPDKTRVFTEQVLTGPWDYGIYSATLDMSSEDGTVVFQDEIPFFIVFPWKTTALIMGAIILIVVIVRIFKKKFKIVKNEKKSKKKSVKK